MDSITIAARLEDEHRMNELVGRMIRKLFEFEGELVSPQTSAAIQYVIEQAMQQAHAFGLDAEEVRRIAARITYTGQKGPVPLAPAPSKQGELEYVLSMLNNPFVQKEDARVELDLLTRAVNLLAQRIKT